MKQHESFVTNAHISHLPLRPVMAALLLIIALLLIGCGGRLLQVTRQKAPSDPPITADQCNQKTNQDKHACELPGIPFYTVKYRCVHTTSWLQPIYIVTLTIGSDEPGFVPVAKTIFLGRSEFNDKSTQATLLALKKIGAIDDYQHVLKVFDAINSIDPLSFDEAQLGLKGTTETAETLLVSNTVSSERFVDSTSVYYYNIEKPHSGTANAEIDLNEEGILAKASGQVEDKTLATILSALPISDLIKGAAGFTPAGQAPPQKGKYKISLDIQTQVYKHTHSVPLTSVPPCIPDSALVASGTYNWTVEDATASPKSSDSGDSKPKTDKTKKSE